MMEGDPLDRLEEGLHAHWEFYMDYDNLSDDEVEAAEEMWADTWDSIVEGRDELGYLDKSEGSEYWELIDALFDTDDDRDRYGIE